MLVIFNVCLVNAWSAAAPLLVELAVGVVRWRWAGAVCIFYAPTADSHGPICVCSCVCVCARVCAAGVESCTIFVALIAFSAPEL